MALEFKAIQPLEYYKKYFAEKVRPDGRDLWASRPTSINIGSLSNADGSALVRLGNTVVICGIKLELASPKADEPKKGYLIPNVDLPALCAAHFRPGPPSEQAQTSTQLVADIINSSKLIDLEDLCIQEGKLVWVVHCDIVCLNYDGTLIDATILALTAALRNLRLPVVSVDSEAIGQPTVDLENRKPLKVHSNPVATTYALFDDDIVLADPTYEEERLASGIVTVVTLEDEQLCGVYKPGGAGIGGDHLQQCISRAKQRGSLGRKLVDSALQTTSPSNSN